MIISFMIQLVYYIFKRKLQPVYIILFSLFCFSNPSKAQLKFTDNLNASVHFHYGYNLPEYPFIYSLTNDYIHSVDFSVYKETTGANKWEQIYNYPDYGFSFFYSTLGNNEVFGREFALTYFYKFYFASINKFRLFNQIGLGLSYVNRKFDLKSNYLNVAVGSNFNIHFDFKFGINYKLSDKMALNMGLSFDHLSNANTSEPNLGLNYLTAFGGISYGLGKKQEKQVQNIEPHVNTNFSSVYLSFGGKHTRSLSSHYYLTSSISYDFTRAISRKIHLGIGSDLFYDSSIKSSFDKNPSDYKKYFHFQTGIHLTQTIVYNRISLSIQEGVYLFMKERVYNYPIYNRGIFQYQLNSNLSVRLSMKSHLLILDFPEIGLGLKL